MRNILSQKCLTSQTKCLLMIKKDEMATCSIFREEMTTSMVTSGNDFSSLYKPTKVLDSKDNIISPNRIAFSRNGMWAVTDGAKHCVNIFNSQDELIQVIGGVKINSRLPKELHLTVTIICT